MYNYETVPAFCSSCWSKQPLTNKSTYGFLRTKFEMTKNAVQIKNVKGTFEHSSYTVSEDRLTIR